MKTLKSNFYILFTLAFILSSCSQSSEDIEIISSKDLIPFFENLRLVNTWTSQVHTTDVAYEIDILDEHNYFFLWSGPSSEITVSNGPNVYPLPPSFDFTAAPGSLTHLNLYCDGYTTRNCWIGGKRICCLPQVE